VFNRFVFSGFQHWKNRRSVQWITGILILFLFVYIIERQYGWTNILQSSEYLYRKTFAGALILIALSYLFRSIRLHDYFHIGSLLRIAPSLRVVLIHNLFNNILPMRSGEISFPVLIKSQFNVSLERSVPALLWFRLLDFYVLTAIGAIALFWLEDGGPFGAWLIAPVLILPPLIFHFRGAMQNYFLKRNGTCGSVIGHLISGMPLHTGDAVRTLVWTILNWSSKLIAYGWILAIIAETKLAYGILGSVTGELSSVLPFHGIAGAGTYEAGVLASLLPLGISPEMAVRAAVNLHLVVLIVSMASALLILPFGKTKKSPAAADESSQTNDIHLAHFYEG
jgi:hypothetical protein